MGEGASQEPPRPYPGKSTTVRDLLRLASEYRKAAHHLLPLGRRGDPSSRAPFRLSAIHAIELYLNAFLLHRGETAASIRGMQHDLATRAERAGEKGLRLRKRTAGHLQSMEEKREYLVSRYSPEMTSTVSQVNRLTATLDEVAEKVTALVGND